MNYTSVYKALDASTRSAVSGLLICESAPALCYFELMALISLLSVDDDLTEYDENKHLAVSALRTSASIDRFGVHSLTEDHAAADIILFVAMGTCGDFAERVRAHPLYRKYPEKCFLFDSADYIRPVLRGIYASLHKKDYAAEHTRTGFYLMPENPFIDYRPSIGPRKYLAAFVGSSNTHPVREGLFQFNRPDILVLDSSNESYRIRYHGTPAEKEEFWQRYANSIADASFSLCPRGRGPGSIRLYESMKMGRACVVISDDWVPNEGVDWDSFAVFVPEKDVAGIPAFIGAIEAARKGDGRTRPRRVGKMVRRRRPFPPSRGTLSRHADAPEDIRKITSHVSSPACCGVALGFLAIHDQQEAAL